MTCDWCDKQNPVVERVEEKLFLCDECKGYWGKVLFERKDSGILAFSDTE
jgi:ribosomal protein L37AE/L43A